MPIDTDDLSDKTYNAILSEAERFHHEFTLHFGLLANQCADEGMFIRKSEELVRKMMTCCQWDMDDIFLTILQR